MVTPVIFDHDIPLLLLLDGKYDENDSPLEGGFMNRPCERAAPFLMAA
jgi:hypothetical protein